MSLPTNNKKTGKQQNTTQKNNPQGSKFISKPGKAVSVPKKTPKTGGTRGS